MSFGGERSKKILMYAMMRQRAKAANIPPEDIIPTITPEEETAILEATLPVPEPEPSFIRRNAVPLFLGGGILTLGLLGMVLLIRV